MARKLAQMGNRLAFVSALLLLVGSAFAASNKEVEELLSKMREAYKNTKAATYKLKATGTLKDRLVKITADVSFLGPDKLYIKATGVTGSTGPAITYILNGKRTLIDDGKSKERSDLQVGAGFPEWSNLETASFYQYQKQLSTDSGANMHFSTFKILLDEKWNDKLWTVLQETANGQGVFVSYYIDPKTYLIWRTTTSDIHTRAIFSQTEVLNLDTKAKVDESLFKIDSSSQKP